MLARSFRFQKKKGEKGTRDMGNPKNERGYLTRHMFLLPSQTKKNGDYNEKAALFAFIWVVVLSVFF